MRQRCDSPRSACFQALTLTLCQGSWRKQTAKQVLLCSTPITSQAQRLIPSICTACLSGKLRRSGAC